MLSNEDLEVMHTHANFFENNDYWFLNNVYSRAKSIKDEDTPFNRSAREVMRVLKMCEIVTKVELKKLLIDTSLLVEDFHRCAGTVYVNNCEEGRRCSKKRKFGLSRCETRAHHTEIEGRIRQE